MAFDPAFLDELRARTPLAAVIGRRTRLVRSGRQHKACCPFHGEKTPSFYVYDDHFHCFGCGAHGDAISFVMQSDGRSFLEAVESLAAEAGLEVPKQKPIDRERAQRQRGLSDVLDAAQRFFVDRLRTPGGEAALEYLRRRGLDGAAIAGWGLGWSGEGRGALIEALRGQDFPPEMIAEAGLMRLDEDGRPKGELFFNRVTFPIRDRRGALVSFGGRILGDGQPKYLNGPETPLFSKRRLLFGLDRAGSALRAVRPGGDEPATRRALVVVEGYMDVISLHQAGFPGAVAPLGTALTPEQLEALWRIAPVPVLCFDGDAAGRRAAIRATEQALPLLDPERSLRFCRLPDGEDPDSLVRSRGPAAMDALLDGAAPLADVLFELLSEGIRDPGPEQRAALHERLTAAAASIAHKGLAAEYRRTLTGRFFEAFARGGRSGGAGRPGGARRAEFGRGGAPTVAAVREPLLDEEAVNRERQRQLLAILLRHPNLLGDVEQALCRLKLPDAFDRVRGAVLDWAGQSCTPAGEFPDLSPPEPSGGLDSNSLLAHLHSAGLSAEVEAILGAGPLPVAAASAAQAMPAEAEGAWWHFLGFLNLPLLAQEVEAAAAAFIADPTAARQDRLMRLREAQRMHQRGEMADEDEASG